MADITHNKHLNAGRRHRTYPWVVKRARHNDENTAFPPPASATPAIAA